MAVLVAYDGSHPARKALRYAIDHHPDEEIILLRVVEAAGGSTAAGFNLAREAIRELREEKETASVEEVEEHFDMDDVEYRVETAIGKPAREIVEFAEDNDVELIVVGNHGREGVSRVLLGSVAEDVVRRAPVPVTVVR